MQKVPILVILKSEETAKKLGDLLFKYFGGAVSITSEEVGFVVTLEDFPAEKYDKAQYFCIGFKCANA